MSDYYIGEIRMFSLNFAPANWVDCDGQILTIQQYQALYSLLGTYFGGDGVKTFGLPDLRGRVAVGAGIASTGTAYQLGKSGGVETVAITTATMPNHNHAVTAETVLGTNVDPTNGYMASAAQGADTNGNTSPAPLVYGPLPGPTTGQQVALNATVVGANGSGAVHNNLQPYVAIRFCIATSGLYPIFS